MTPALAKIAWLIGVVGWFVIRYPHNRRARKTPIKASRRDVRERILLSVSFAGLGIVPALYAATGFPRAATYAFHPIQGYAGAAVFLASLWLFYRTHRDLGRNWSVSLDVRDRHTLVQQGVYAYVRHPMYAAFWLWALAQALLLPNLIAGPAGLVGFGTLYVLRVSREEQLMIAEFGDSYRAYMATTARIIPGIY